MMARSSRLQPLAVFCIFLMGLEWGGAAQAQSSVAAGSLTIETQRAASVVFLNNVRHGVTSEEGKLVLPRVKPGRYALRVRSVGFVDWKSSVLVVGGKGRSIKVAQAKTTDEATVHYQQGDQFREQGKHNDAIKEYQAALALRQSFPAVRIGMARSLITLRVFDGAETQIQAAIKNPGVFAAEAHTVLGNLRRAQGLLDEAADEYQRALRIARGISPEAHVGLGLTLEESGDLEGAIKEFRIGIPQDLDTEPILYYLLGAALEKARHPKEAVEAYNTYLRLDPEGPYASAIQSVIERLKAEIDRT